jgi:hypothetical protein
MEDSSARNGRLKRTEWKNYLRWKAVARNYVVGSHDWNSNRQSEIALGRSCVLADKLRRASYSMSLALGYHTVMLQLSSYVRG